jgi:hypothetical protein
VLFIPSCLGYTGLTGALDRSDRCNPCWDFARVNVCVCSLLSCVAAVTSLGRFGARLACLVFWGFLAQTGLTGVLHRFDRCGAFLWKSPSFTSRDRSDRWCSPVSPVLVSGLEVWCSAALSGRKVVCWKPCSSCWSFHLLREEFLSAPIHSDPSLVRRIGPSVTNTSSSE